jgi:hypothetical protein
MAAGVVEGTHLAVAAAHHRHRVVADLQRQVLARLLQLEGMASEDPLAVPDLLEILAVHVGVAVGQTRQAMALLALTDQVQYGGFLVHCYRHSRTGAGCIGACLHRLAAASGSAESALPDGGYLSSSAFG